MKANAITAIFSDLRRAKKLYSEKTQTIIKVAKTSTLSRTKAT
jgi:hypothetical protein